MRNFIFQSLAMFFALLLCVSCASSRKIIARVSSSAIDSTFESVLDSAKYTEIHKGTTSVATVDSSKISVSIKENGENAETIIEHITETIDISGNKVTMTDRTTYRKGDYHKHTDADLWQNSHQQKLSLFVDSLDSVVHHRINTYQSYILKSDSLSDIHARNTSDIKPKRNTGRRLLLIFFSLVTIGYILYKRQKR
ncbi:MAG TPA: hypothetical protein DD384_04455 [Firmicutes bacterium]|nr:hypothetical protein [Bacillota bacterium]